MLTDLAEANLAESEEKQYLAVFHRDGDQMALEIPLPYLKGKNVQIHQSYPTGYPCRYEYCEETNVLRVELENRTARLFEIKIGRD